MKTLKEKKPQRLIKVNEVRYRKFRRRENQLLKVKTFVREAWKILQQVG